jgi:hypothetical protein
MRSRRVRRPGSDRAETVIPLGASPTNLIPNSKILFLGAFASFVAAVSMLFRAGIPSIEGKGTLNCYDAAGNYEPCATRASASPLQFIGRTTGAVQQSANWTKTALYQQAIWPIAPSYQQVIRPTTGVYQPANWTTGARAARRSSALGRRPGLVTCERRLIPCFVSALRSGLIHIASVAATVGQARSTREHL